MTYQIDEEIEGFSWNIERKQQRQWQWEKAEQAWWSRKYFRFLLQSAVTTRADNLCFPNLPPQTIKWKFFLVSIAILYRFEMKTPYSIEFFFF